MNTPTLISAGASRRSGTRSRRIGASTANKAALVAAKRMAPSQSGGMSASRIFITGQLKPQTGTQKASSVTAAPGAQATEPPGSLGAGPAVTSQALVDRRQTHGDAAELGSVDVP